jgi:hypothetical protein
MTELLYRHTLLGPIRRPVLWERAVVFPDGRIHRPAPGEHGLVIATVLRAGALQWVSFSHNERVDSGAARQALQMFGGGPTPGAVVSAQFKWIGVANTLLTAVGGANPARNKANRTIGSTSAPGETPTNEFTTLGLIRAAATVIAGNYTAPTTNGGQFTQVISHTFTATGSATATGAALFDGAPGASTVMYAEDNFTSNAVLTANDTLRIDWAVSN